MNIYDKAIADLRDRRRTAQDDALMRLNDALEKNTELQQAYRDRLDQMILAAQGLENDLPKSRERFRKALEKAGIDEKDLEPPYECELCHDTGKVNGKYCRCVIKAAIAENRDNLALPLVDFEKARSTAPSAAAKKAYEVASEYIDSDITNFIITGEPGTGKTYLAAATAAELMKNGLSVVTLTAFSFVRRALEYHTQFSIKDYVDGFTPMLDCDLLVIDDLGTESILKNVTKEYLYTVADERWRNGKRTVITTNKTPAELIARYGENVFSRLCDRSRSFLIKLSAVNERMKRKTDA